MIRTFKHKGLKAFYDTGSKAGIQPKHANRLTVLLTSLDYATTPGDMDIPGYGFHELKADRKGTYSVMVNGNWRVTFEWEGSDAILTNYEDYH